MAKQAQPEAKLAKAVKSATKKMKSNGRGRNVYFRNENIWEDLTKLADKQDRSVNFLLEKAATELINNQ